MVTLMVGVLLVALSAIGFGVALFGSRPVPQPAMSLSGTHLGAPTAEPFPSMVDPVSDDGRGALVDDGEDGEDGGVLAVGRLRRMLQREPTADHQPAADVTLSPWVRARSAMYLTLIVTGLAAVIGIVTSIVVVGVVLFVT
jgi:hypothetical protein